MKINTRLNWIDWAKFIGIFLVVFGHAYWRGDALPVRAFIYSFQMPFFFFLSGYLHRDSDNVKEYLSKNIRTLFIPYLILPILACSYVIPLWIHNDVVFNLKTILYGYLTGNVKCLPSSAFWFVYCLMLIKLLVFFLLKISKILQVLFVIIGFILVYYHVLLFNFRIDAALIAIAFFFIGYYLHRLQVMELLKNNSVIFFSFIASLSVLLFTSQLNGPNVDVYLCLFGESVFLYYFNAILGSFMIFMLAKLLNSVQSKFMTVIASGTLLIMAFHAPGITYNFLAESMSIPDSLSISIPIKFIISVLNIILLYYPILFIQKYASFILGGRKAAVRQ